MNFKNGKNKIILGITDLTYSDLTDIKNASIILSNCKAMNLLKLEHLKRIFKNEKLFNTLPRQVSEAYYL